MPWSVVQTRPNAAKKVCENLLRQEFEFYDPRVDERVIHRGLVTIRRVQLFQDYLFVTAVDRWRALKSTLGVRQLLMIGDELPATIPDDLIVSLKARENADGAIVLSKSRFRIGQSVQVKRGVCEYELGIFDGQSARDRVYVLMNWLGSFRRIEINEGNLVAV